MTVPVPEVSPRPTPLRDVAMYWSKSLGIASGLVIALGTIGVLSTDQAAALGSGLTGLDVLFAAVLGVITSISNGVIAFRTAKTGEALVTPISDPRDDKDRELVPRAENIQVDIEMPPSGRGLLDD